MAINTQLLRSAAILQDYLVDKDSGLPLVAGKITLYQDNSRTTLKNWYYQTGIPGNYTYIPLPNPMTLSAAGTISDFNGNDVIPFYYPFDETDNSTFQAYYITVDDSNGERQFTRQNFPFIANENSNIVSVNTNKNLIVNSVFWRNISSINVVPGSSQDIVLCPSQHDGYNHNMADMHYIKNTSDSTETISFLKFGAQILSNDVTPEFYMNLHCTGIGTETTKYLQIPLSLHLTSMAEYQFGTFVLHAQSEDGNPNNVITITLYQFSGTGTVSPVLNISQTIPLGVAWNKYLVSIPLPLLPASLSGSPGDDAYFIQIGFPTAKTCNINLAKPSFYLNQTVPINDLDTYEFVSGTIDSPRTGDIRTSMNAFQPYGWVWMNDQTIGSASSGSTARANIDTWPLFNLIWSSVSILTNATSIIPIYDSSGSPTTYGASSIADWNANKRLSLPKSLGRVFMGGLNDGSGTYQGNIYTRSGNTLILNAASTQFFTGTPVTLTTTGTTPSGISANTVYYAIYINSTTISLATTYANALAATAITLSSAGTGTNSVFTYISPTSAGEFMHTQLVGELSSHNHPGSIMNGAIQNYCAAGASSTYNTTGGSGSTAISIAAQGGSAPFNIVQPFTVMNVFMKL